MLVVRSLMRVKLMFVKREEIKEKKREKSELTGSILFEIITKSAHDELLNKAERPQRQFSRQ